MAVSTRYSHALAGIAVVLALAGAAAPAQAQTWPGRPKAAERASPYRPLTGFSPPAIILATVAETEPNDSLSTANEVTMRDTVTGTIDPGTDVDYFTVTITAGTAVDLDVDASQVGSPLDPMIALFDSTGMMLAFNDNADGLDSRIRYTIRTTGRYFVGIASAVRIGGSTYTYALKFGILPPGPGDPTTLFASGIGYPRGMAADASGNLFLVDQNANRIVRVDAAGAASTYLSLGNTGAPQGYPVDLVVDGFGDLLAAGTDSAWQGGTVLRITGPGAAPTHFARFQGYATAITVGPDGDVWVANGGCGCLLRFDPTGARKDSIWVGWSVTDLAFSPSGALHFVTGYDMVLKLEGRTPVTVIQATPYLETIAFDRDAYLYVGNGYLGEVTLYDAAYRRVGDVIARSNLGGPLTLAFGRGTDGTMTSRLFAANGTYNLAPPFAGGIVAMNPSGIRAPGFRIGIDLLRLSTTALRNGAIGAEYVDTVRLANPPAGQQRWSIANGVLPAGLALDAGTRFLDLVGNRNGRYDIGDFRAYLRAKNLLPTASRAAAAIRREGKP